MIKNLTEKEKRLLNQQTVCVIYKEFYKDDITTITRIVEFDDEGIAIETDTGYKVIFNPNIKNIFRKNVNFVNPKLFFNKEVDEIFNTQMDKINTEIIEKIKNLPEYELSTRSAKFTKNGSFQKKKISQQQFEFEVFNWVKMRKNLIELCPLALLNHELLLALYQKRFLLFKKNFSIVFDTQYNDINTIVNFIFEQNEQIKQKRDMSLRGIVDDLLF